MRGRLSYHKWSIVDTGLGCYLAERIVDRKPESHELSAHCLACAKAEILLQYAGQVDYAAGISKATAGSFYWQWPR